MTRDEAIPMLCVACGVSPASADINVTALHSIVDKLIAAEREACAKVCENLGAYGKDVAIQKATLSDAASAIRARRIEDDCDTESN